MTSTSKPIHPDSMYTPCWDYEAKTPIVDGKYEDPKTGELRTASKEQYCGPPAVDLVVVNLHEDTNHCCYRSQRSFPVEKLLCHIMRVVHDRKLKLDSVNATAYAIRIVLSHELTRAQFIEVTDDMSNGIWDQI